jgi:hypothetical protein
MNRTYVRRPGGTNEPKTLTFVGSTWPMNVRHVGPHRPRCHVGLMFVGSPTNIRAMWQPMNIRIFLFFPILSASLTGEPLKQVYNIQYTNNSKHIDNIKQSNTSNITSIDPTPPRHINIQTLQVLECTAHHSAGSLYSAPPPLVLSTIWANSSPFEASRCESEISKA